MPYSGDFQAVVELATNKVREAGYTDLESRSEYADQNRFRIDHYSSAPANLTVEPIPSRETVIRTVRDGIAQLFNSAPLSLRKLFAPFMAQVFSALELQDFELAHSIAADVDTSVVSDPNERALAESLQSQIVVALAGLMGV
jgi:hypothetical protein